MAEENEFEETQKKSKTMLIIIIAIVVNVAIVAVVIVVLSGKGGDSKPDPKAAAATPNVPAPGQGPGPLVEMDNFVVNVQSEEGAKYLKAGLVVELTHETMNDPFGKWDRLLRNEVLIYLSSLDVEQTRTVKQKRNIEGRLKAIINKRIGTEMVSGVYFTEFVTQ